MSEEMKESRSEVEPVDILESIKAPKNEINVNLDNTEHNVVENVTTHTHTHTAEPKTETESTPSFYSLEFIKYILFRILNIIYNRFFDVVNDLSCIYTEAYDKLS